MNRRDFLQQSAIAGTAVTAIGCGASLTTQAPRTQMSAEHGRDLVARLDTSLAYIENLRLLSGEVGRDLVNRSSSVRTYLEHAEPMAKRAVQSLVVAAAAKEIGPDVDMTDDVRDAFARRIPLLDHHVLETTALFARMPLQDRRRVGRVLRDDPELPMRVAQRIDNLGQGIDVARNARNNVHEAARDISFRLTKQPPSAFLDEQVRKVERVAAVRGMDATLARMIATHETTTAILQQIAGGGGGTGVEGELDQPLPQPPPQIAEVPAEPERDPNYRRGVVPLAIGGMLLGTGAILLGVFIPVMVVNSIDTTVGIIGAVGITAGSLLAVGGIVLLIVGAALSAES